MTITPVVRDDLLTVAGRALDPSRFPVRRLWAARLHTVGAGSVRQPSAPMSPGQTRAVEFDLDHPLSVVRVRLHTFGSTATEVVLALVRTGDGEDTVVASEHLHPAIDQVWYELCPALPSAGCYELRVTVVCGTAAPAAPEGADDNSIAWQAETVEYLPLELLATDDGLRVHGATDAVIGFELPWRYDGYSVSASDGVGFDTVISCGGRYVPAQEFKRTPTWPFSIDDTEVAFLSGPTGFVVRSTAGLSLTGQMFIDTMTVTARASDGVIDFSTTVQRDDLTQRLPRFEASDWELAERLTRFYWERALSWPFRDYTASAVGWRHWMTRVLSWTDTDGAASQAVDLAETPQDEAGWLWTRTDCEGWPFPDPTRYDTRHPSASLSYVAGMVTHYSWTGDDDWLATQLPRARRAMTHIIDSYGVREYGLLVNSIPDQDGQAGSLGSHYWDIVPGGHKDAYANVLLYEALIQLARLERHCGEDERAVDLAGLAERVKRTFETEFWNDTDGRFVQNIDVAGTVHDYGATYLNLEALALGLGTDEQARRVLNWLDTGNSELTDRVVLASPSGDSVRLGSGVPAEQEFTAAGFRSVAALVTATDPAVGFTMTLLSRDGTELARRRFERWWDRGWASLDVGDQPPGDYRLRLTADAAGLGWQRGSNDDGIALSLAAVSGHHPGARDIYSAWRFAPRATTRRNDFWYTFGWSGVETSYGDQVQDGGTSLYISGFDIEARARVSPDLAWQRLIEVLDRAGEPDLLCGGGPLWHGEIPQAALPGQVGVDNPFPESGLVPFAALPAFLGLDPRPDGLVLRPNLPRVLDRFGIANVIWRGVRLRIVADHESLTVTTPTSVLTCRVDPGCAAVLCQAADRLALHPLSTRKGTR
ncbi:MAG: hypothetical protein VB080_12135 [Propionicimonas sp.]|uniref:glycosyl hydrolase family 65 protein n=1 Tax=Propionicimonas sp. TaxID=1955623 RepID=UPI002B2088D1|nr:glycosyl hydrolase family 65 protein [Propionicimonas sp.]MEA4945172.1 hypothetical protein [Propionicimonas sp.]